MKPSSFEYHAPTTVEEALSLVDEYGEEARVLAGGQSLVPLMAMRLSRTEHLVDLNRIEELAQVGSANGHLDIGAMTRQATIEHSETVAGAVPLLTRATPHIGHFQIRNRGTIGGSLAHADPASEYPAVALALDAQIEIRSHSSERIANAEDFFEGMWTTSLGPTELLTGVRFPVRSNGEGFAIDEIARRHGDFALVGAAVHVRVDSSDTVTACGIGLFGVGPKAVRAPEAEAAIVGSGPDADLNEIAKLAVAGLSPSDDIHASGRYRVRVGMVSVRRALAKALEEARDA